MFKKNDFFIENFIIDKKNLNFNIKEKIKIG
jgi:hypothetical protein